jgi:hypothetical protein
MQPFWHDVFASIKKDHPALRLDLRAKDLPDAIINDALDLGLKANVSTKYWMEQMGLPFHPTHTNVEDQKNRRHSYADLFAVSAAVSRALAGVERRHHTTAVVRRSGLRAEVRGAGAACTTGTVSRLTKCWRRGF